jgi:hypothetical protein
MTVQFTADRTSSNRAGVTLMNNQVDHVVAEVMHDKDAVRVEEMPSMIANPEDVAEYLGCGLQPME